MIQTRRLASAGLAAAALFASGQGASAQSPASTPAPEEASRFKLSGSVRLRSESLDGQYRPGLDGGDQLVSLRTIVRAELDLSPVTLVAELWDARGWSADEGSGITNSEINTLDFLQAHVRIDTPDLFGSGGKASTRLGRFTLDQGARRLVAVSNYPNMTAAFTGAALDWTRGDHTLSLFYTLPQRRLPSDKASLLDNEHEWDDESGDVRFWGAFYSRKALFGRSAGEAYVYGLEEADGLGAATRNRDLVTAGGRLYRDPAAGAWDFELEGGWQGGTARASSGAADVTDLDVSAQFVHAEVGYRFEAPWSPRLAFEYDFASGDRSPTDGEYNRFDALFGSRTGDFGPSGLYGPLGRANISSPGVRLEIAPSPRLDAFLFYRALWLDEARDAFSSTGVQDASGASGRFAGSQLETKVRYWLVPRSLRLEISGAVLFADDFLRDAPNATDQGDTVYLAIDVTKTF